MSTLEHVIVAVDGPSGSGKSSVSRAVAREFGLQYLDTGAMYRALTWASLREGIDLTDADAIAKVSGSVTLAWSTNPDESWISVDGTDVSQAIREQPVTSAVSTVAAEPRTRAALVDLQRQAVHDSLALGHGIVMEGRDIGTVVLPNADLKVWLVADPEVRAARRAAEDAAAGRSGAEYDVGASSQQSREAGLGLLATVTGPSEVAVDLARRDSADASRVVSPAMQAEDAILVDASHLTLAEVVAAVVALVRERMSR